MRGISCLVVVRAYWNSGRDQEIRANDQGVYIADVTPGSPAAVDGRLRVGVRKKNALN